MDQKEYKEYLCSFQHEGKDWGLTLFATSKEDAEQKMRAISYGEVVGEIKARITPGTSLLARFKSWFQGKVTS